MPLPNLGNGRMQESVRCAFEILMLGEAMGSRSGSGGICASNERRWRGAVDTATATRVEGVEREFLLIS